VDATGLESDKAIASPTIFFTGTRKGAKFPLIAFASICGAQYTRSCRDYLLRGPPEGVDRQCSARGHSERSHPAMKILDQGG
jgi:hypothetical protein